LLSDPFRYVVAEWLTEGFRAHNLDDAYDETDGQEQNLGSTELRPRAAFGSDEREQLSKEQKGFSEVNGTEDDVGQKPNASAAIKSDNRYRNSRSCTHA
jgi:hypothetical protein